MPIQIKDLQKKSKKEFMYFCKQKVLSYLWLTFSLVTPNFVYKNTTIVRQLWSSVDRILNFSWLAISLFLVSNASILAILQMCSVRLFAWICLSDTLCLHFVDVIDVSKCLNKLAKLYAFRCMDNIILYPLTTWRILEW